jgi:hypothetical protein
MNGEAVLEPMEAADLSFQIGRYAPLILSQNQDTCLVCLLRKSCPINFLPQVLQPDLISSPMRHAIRTHLYLLRALHPRSLLLRPHYMMDGSPIAAEVGKSFSGVMLVRGKGVLEQPRFKPMMPSYMGGGRPQSGWC